MTPSKRFATSVTHICLHHRSQRPELTIWFYMYSSWKGEGLKSWEITQFAPDQIYQIQAILKFESLAAWEAASTGKNSEAVFGDIAKFTTAKPVVVKGTHHGSENVV